MAYGFRKDKSKEDFDAIKDITSEVTFVPSNGGEISNYSAVKSAGIILINGSIKTTREISNGSLQLGSFYYNGKRIANTVGTRLDMYYNGQNTDSFCYVWQGFISMAKRSTNIQAGTTSGFAFIAAISP